MGGDSARTTCEYSFQDHIIKYPTSTTFCKKNITKAVLRNTKKYRENCPNVWITDVRANHIRNRRLLDLPLARPGCCSKIYNAMIDRQKLKKLQKYNLNRPVRAITSDLEPEVVIKCSAGELTRIQEKTPIRDVDEFYQVSESSSDDEDSDVSLKACRSGSLSECSGCSTIGPIKKRKIHKIPKLHWQDLLHGSEVEYCKNVVLKMLSKYKGHPNAVLKLDKFNLK